MRKLKLNPVVLDTLDNDQLKRIMGGALEADTDASTVFATDGTCLICEVAVTRKTTTTKKPIED